MPACNRHPSKSPFAFFAVFSIVIYYGWMLALISSVLSINFGERFCSEFVSGDTESSLGWKHMIHTGLQLFLKYFVDFDAIWA
jgi:hypothetical protein